jgi:hypothetical protein
MISFKKILAVALVSAIVAFAQNTDWYTANPEKDTFYISTEAQLQGLSELTNRSINPINFSGKTIILLNDITLSQNHTPIGSNSSNTIATQFLGTFDGNGHSISNVSVSLSGNYVDYTGLFGYVGAGGQIKNIVVNVTNITIGSYIGGLAGAYASTKPIENCGVNISGSTIGPAWYHQTFGGLVGLGAAAITITDSYTTGNILSSANYSGGLVGDVGLSSEITITNSYTTGNISSSYCSGGLVGHVNAITITNSYATGNISSSTLLTSSGSEGYSGGLVGYGVSNTITNCYASGAITVTGDGIKYIGGIFGGYGSGTNTSVYYNSTRASAAAGSGSPTGIIGLPPALLRRQESFNWDFQNVWAIKSGSYPYLRYFNANISEISIEIWDGTRNMEWFNQTQQNEYTIYTAEELAGFAFLVNTGNSMSGKTIKLGANIMLNDTTNWQNWGTNPPANTWTMIGGNKVYRFQGTFDGDGFIVSGAYIDSDVYPDTYDGYGLFSVTKGATIKITGITASYIVGKNKDNVGTLIGKIDGGIISDCYSTGIVSGSGNYIGGLAGYYTRPDIDTSYIQNCYSQGVVSGSGNYIGGLVGGINSSYITNGNNVKRAIVRQSVSTCKVIANGGNNVGGLVGNTQDSFILDCYAIGAVSGNSNVGGLVGGNSSTVGDTVKNCYSTGSVSGHLSDGGLLGYETIGNSNVNNSYWDTQTSGKSLDRGLGSYGYTTLEMRQQNNYINWNWNYVWEIDNSLNNGYPFLKNIWVVDVLNISYTDPGGEVFIPVSDISGIPTLATHNQAITLNGTILPQTATNKAIGWSVVNSAQGTITNGNTFTPLTIGEIQIKATIINGLGGGNNYEKIFTINVSDGNTSISDVKKSNSHYGIKFKKNVVSDELEIVKIILPDGKDGKIISVVIYDNTGNVVFSGENAKVWDLRNKSGRIVANGSYLVIVEAKDKNGKSYWYSAKIGVKK